MKKISILGSTGSIGTQTLEVVSEHPHKLKVVGLTTNTNIELLEKQIAIYKPEAVAVRDVDKAEILRKKISIKVYEGMEGLSKLATLESADTVVTAVVGSVGLKPTLDAIRKKKQLCIANKETLVVAGDIVMDEAAKNNVEILPVDSEHSALFQSLKSGKPKEVEKLILTASGGPFRTKTAKEIEKVTLKDALKHPTWDMGAKITVDSATMMNKGLEVIEAHHLFKIPYDKIDVVVHPQSIIHSMVQFVDGSTIAQLGTPSMKTPIQYALTYPERLEGAVERIDWGKIQELTFEKPDYEKFKCLKLAKEAGIIGGSMPAVMNAANEIAVGRFIKEQISFQMIPDVISKIMQAHKNIQNPDIDQLIQADLWSRKKTEELLK